MMGSVPGRGCHDSQHHPFSRPPCFLPLEGAEFFGVGRAQGFDLDKRCLHTVSWMLHWNALLFSVSERRNHVTLWLRFCFGARTERAQGREGGINLESSANSFAFSFFFLTGSLLIVDVNTDTTTSWTLLLIWPFVGKGFFLTSKNSPVVHFVWKWL